MKKFLVLGISLFALKFGSAQYSLTFCETVGDDGRPNKPSNSFMVAHDGSSLKVLLKSDKKLDSDQLTFKIFFINEAGKEEAVSELSQKIEPAWTYVWKDIVFFDSGSYRIKVYNTEGTYLTSANLKVKQQ